MSVAHAERAHALLSASGSHRWLTCTPSARLEETLPDTTSEAAKEGTLAHEIAELKIRKFVEPMAKSTFTKRMKKFKEHELYQDEMDRYTDAYLEYIQGIVHSFSTVPYVAVEKKLDYSTYAPEGFGTVDCIIIAGTKMYVNDFKYGKGVAVSAEDNPQMKLYALAALATYGFLYSIETVQLAIIQPRIHDQPSEWTSSVSDLQAWGETIKPIAQQAFEGKGEFTPGEHCTFCRAKETCRARVDSIMTVEPLAPMKPPLISWEEAADVLRRAEGIVSWYNALKKLALARLLEGGDVPGWKAVNGRGSREFVDLDQAFEHLKSNGIDEAILFERKPLTVPAIEKVLKAADYKKLLVEPGHVMSKPGAPTLVPESDKRDPITRKSAVDDFKNNDGGNSDE